MAMPGCASAAAALASRSRRSRCRSSRSKSGASDFSATRRSSRVSSRFVNDAHAAASEQPLDAVLPERVSAGAVAAIGSSTDVAWPSRREEVAGVVVGSEHRPHFVLDVVVFGRGADECLARSAGWSSASAYRRSMRSSRSLMSGARWSDRWRIRRSSARLSHARATVQSRFTVAGEISQRFGALLDAQAAEVAQLDDLCLPLVLRGEPLERLVERHEIDVAGTAARDGEQMLVERDARRVAAALGGVPPRARAARGSAASTARQWRGSGCGSASCGRAR